MKVTMAALLHDIGKFYQRTGIPLGNNPLYNSNVKSNGSYAHGGFTAKFIDENLNSKLPDFSDFIHLSSFHHLEPNDNSFVKKADVIASGQDRRDEVSSGAVDVKELDSINTGNYVTKRLDSIFNEVHLEKDDVKKGNHIGLSKLHNLKNYEGDVLDNSSAKEEYKKLYQEMISVIKGKELDTITSYKLLHQFIYPLIKEYTVSIPSNTYTQYLSSVSLFDHLKLTAAVASCLEKTTNDYCYCVDYDVSGIQKFIYKVSEGRESKKGLAKQLRTRSFYLSVLSDFIAYYIINEFGLSYENVLYSSGGRGRLLIYGDEYFEDKIKKINNNITNVLFKIHQVDISFSINYSKIDVNQLGSTSIGDLVRYDNKEIVSDKRRKFECILNDDSFSNFLKPLNKPCYMCSDNEASGDGLCRFCKNMLELNDNVLTKYSDFIIEFSYDNQLSSLPLFTLNFESLGKIAFYPKKDLNLKINENSYFISMNCDLLGETKFYAFSNIGTKSFEDISKASEGDEKLAVVKMDVDNLGYIFSHGIDKEFSTISKNLTLSRMIDSFFTHDLVSIVNQSKYKSSIYINYAGGDDVVLIVPASVSLELVKDINDHFNKYTGNRSFHISSGIDIFNSSSPVRYSIDRAEDALFASKNINDRDSFTIFDISMKNSKMDSLLSDIEEIKDAFNADELSRSGIYEIYTYILMSLDFDNTLEHFMHFIPLIAYSIKRNLENNTKWFNKFKEIFVTPLIDLNTLKYYKVVFAYALMTTREIGGLNE